MGALPSKEMSRMVAIDQVARDAISGDLLLFRGNTHNFFSHTVAALQAPVPWTHVGVLIRDPDGGKLYVFHSTVDLNSINVRTLEGRIPQYKTGPKLTPFKDAIKGYGGERVAVRYAILTAGDRRQPNIVGRHNVAMWSQFETFFNKYGATPYQEGKLEMLSAVLHGNTHETVDSFFCSEMVAQFFMEIGWLPNDDTDETYQPANNYDLRWLSSPHMTREHHDLLVQTKVLGFSEEIDIGIRENDGTLVAYFQQPERIAIGSAEGVLEQMQQQRKQQQQQRGKK